MAKIFDDEYRKLAKKLNQRLVEAEKRGMWTPGILKMYQELERLGRHRFSETGKADTIEELEANKKLLKELEKTEGTTVTSYKNQFSSPDILVEDGLAIDKSTGEIVDDLRDVPAKYDYDYVIDYGDDEYEYEEIPLEVDLIVDNFRDFVSKFPDRVAEPMINALDTIVNEAGKEKVAYALYNMPDAYHTYLYYVKMGDYEKSASQMSSNIINMLPGLTNDEKSNLENLVTQIVYESISDEDV